MTLRQTLRTAAATLAVAVVGLGATAASAQSTVKIDGSSTVYPVTEAVAEEFQKENKDVRVTVGISGTGGGFKKFVRGEIDIADASRPISAKEMEEAKANGIEYIELPVAFDALTVVVNPKADWVDHLTVAELKKIECFKEVTRGPTDNLPDGVKKFKLTINAACM